MARLIDADALWKKLEFEQWYDNADMDEIALPLVADAPTVDAVPVVRCKDCKNWGGVAFGNVCRRWSAPLFGMKNCTGPDDFCSYGERKNND